MTTITEALASPNVQAFLRAIRLGEGTSDANGYRRIAVYDYTSGTTFKAYLFDHAGVAVTGDVAWTIRGV